MNYRMLSIMRKIEKYNKQRDREAAKEAAKIAAAQKAESEPVGEPDPASGMPEAEAPSAPSKGYILATEDDRTCPYCGGRKDKLEFLCYYSPQEAILWSDYRHLVPDVGVPSLVQRCPHCGKLYAIEAEGVQMNDTADFEWIDPVTWDYFKQSYREYSALEKSDLIDYNHRLRIRCAFNDEFRRMQYPPQPTEEDQQIFKDNQFHLLRHLTEPLDQAEIYREAGMYAECVEVLDKVVPDSGPMAAYANHIRTLAQAQNPWPFGWRAG